MERLRFFSATLWLFVNMVYTVFVIFIFSFHKLQYLSRFIKSSWILLWPMMVELLLCQITRSSAKCAFMHLRLSVMSFIKIRKSVQLRADPCGRPSSWVAFEERVSFNLVWISLSVKKALTHTSFL